MYKVAVTTRILKDRDVLHLFTPIFIWMILFFIIFGIMCITNISVLVLLLFLEFLCIIPVTIRSIKNAGKLRHESVRKTDVILTAQDGMLYKDNIKLNVVYSEKDHEVYLDTEKYNHRLPTFFGIISGKDVGGFIVFCQENHIEIEAFNE